jgi:hypothetical protein
MDTVLHCDCGFEARAADAEGLAAEVQRHAREVHGMALSDHEALQLAFRVELDATTWTGTRGSRTTRKEEE